MCTATRLKPVYIQLAILPGNFTIIMCTATRQKPVYIKLVILPSSYIIKCVLPPD